MNDDLFERKYRKLVPSDIDLMFALRQDGMVLREIAEKFEVSVSHCCRILRGERWSELHER